MNARGVFGGFVAGVVFFFAVGTAEGLRTRMLSWEGPDVPSPIVVLSAAVALVVAGGVLLLARRGPVGSAALAAFAGALLVLTAVAWARDPAPDVLAPLGFSWQLAASRAANSLVTAAAFGVAVAAAGARLLARDREPAHQHA